MTTVTLVTVKYGGFLSGMRLHKLAVALFHERPSEHLDAKPAIAHYDEPVAAGRWGRLQKPAYLSRFLSPA